MSVYQCLYVIVNQVLIYYFIRLRQLGIRKLEGWIVISCHEEYFTVGDTCWKVEKRKRAKTIPVRKLRTSNDL